MKIFFYFIYVGDFETYFQIDWSAVRGYSHRVSSVPRDFSTILKTLSDER